MDLHLLLDAIVRWEDASHVALFDPQGRVLASAHRDSSTFSPTTWLSFSLCGGGIQSMLRQLSDSTLTRAVIESSEHRVLLVSLAKEHRLALITGLEGNLGMLMAQASVWCDEINLLLRT